MLQKWNAFLTPLLVLVVAVTENVTAEDATLETLEPLRWNHRVILVHAPGGPAARAIANLEERVAQISDRDIAWFVLSEDSLNTNYEKPVGDNLRAWIIQRHFTPRPESTAVVLIGKDGGVKQRSADLDLESTFGLIDSMPMRQAEMRGSDRP